MDYLKAYSLLHKGSLALSVAERNGVRIDLDYCKKAKEQLQTEMKPIEEKIWKSNTGKHWREKYGDGATILSDEQLVYILYKYLKLWPPNKNKREKPCADKEWLSGLDHPLPRLILRYKKLQKMESTYINNLILETNDDGRMRPFFNLHLINSYRSSSEAPNFQNYPIRDKEMGRIIRSALLPSIGNHLVEIDYSALEVHIAECYHHDPTMYEYLVNNKDMHKDTALDCFFLTEEDWEYLSKENKVNAKAIRHAAKNKMVFPIFYGSYFVLIALDLWNSLTEDKLMYRDGMTLKEHVIRCMDAKNLDREEQFEYFQDHIKEMEQKFWNERFPVYKQWRKDWYNLYLTRGYFDLKTGFRCSGAFTRNQVINYPVQGAAFHCLLWSFIELTDYIKRNKMQTKLIGQIHDSIIADVPPSELDHYIHTAKNIMTVKLREAWNWITIPLKIEAEVSPIDKSWYEKTVYKKVV